MPAYAAPVLPGAPGAPSSPVVSPTCDELDNAKFVWTMVGAASGTLAGTGGLASLPITDTPTKDALAGVALGIGVLSVVSAIATTHYDTVFKEKNCVPVTSVVPAPVPMVVPAPTSTVPPPLAPLAH